ncbi:MAG: YqiA/YcfP family alpha/beta fold hydrolase [Leptolyngbyaceae cyanobacterium MO_188.B28]|nr:YqiA/YcfP family alpha/beta fold hydrolase [Leptolyngbyaceae cyanobacterium MO_188.B28]
MLKYLYLHGFASSPQSSKAQYLRSQFQSLGIDLHIPDLNQANFTHLTLTRQIQQASKIMEPWEQVVLIGSSFGSLTAAWLTQHPDLYPKINRLILLAPAFRFLDHWLPKLGPDQLRHWQTEGVLEVYHYGHKAALPLNYQFIIDAQKYNDDHLQTPITTLILHGRQDDVIPIQASRDYAETRPWTRLIELEGDHSLGNVQPEIWQAVRDFLEISV